MMMRKRIVRLLMFYWVFLYMPFPLFLLLSPFIAPLPFPSCFFSLPSPFPSSSYLCVLVFVTLDLLVYFIAFSPFGSCLKQSLHLLSVPKALLPSSFSFPPSSPSSLPTALVPQCLCVCFSVSRFLYSLFPTLVLLWLLLVFLFLYCCCSYKE